MPRLSVFLIAALALGTPAAAQTPTLPYDHIHLNVPDPAAAASWYEKHFGGKRITEAPDRLMFGSTRFMFLRNATAKPSAGSAIDHIGFSFADLDAKMKELEAAGIKVTTPLRDVPGLFKLAFVEDPWGTRIEVVQDAELPGLHHIHLRGPNPEEAIASSGFGPRRWMWCRPSSSASCTTSMRAPHGSSTKASLNNPGTSRAGVVTFTPAASSSFILASRSAT
ncbi:MAG TPA: VOC family protein, partial [Vicinamibacterales bacterium]|nr:VOC family protein [Vicinamibacterales bacterium]